ncbi:hypothetical protein EIP91_001586 [Steccherinum ochraceum]|uniref:Ubiquitin-like protease family profile domain-containing protein n=1 Tax=Steccherinum ochraceum TaxID=92696 RepID=A0A4R0RK51_9APHY|nr:hypothetical protein EIP91_001586 [Steccherinum ochraceum]
MDPSVVIEIPDEAVPDAGSLAIPTDVVAALQLPGLGPASALDCISDVVELELPPMNVGGTHVDTRLYFDASPPEPISPAALAQIAFPTEQVIRTLRTFYRSNKDIQSQSRSVVWEDRKLPLFVISVWEKLSELFKWQQALSWIERVRRRISSAPGTISLVEEVSTVYDSLLELGLAALVTIDGVNHGHAIELAAYGSDDWFADTHIDQMLAVLTHDLNHPNPRFSTRILSTGFTSSLLHLYDTNTASSMPSIPRYMQEMGNLLASKHVTSVGGIFNINSNHWVAAVVDLEEMTISYGNSMEKRSALPQNLPVLGALEWWLGGHGIHGFLRVPMNMTLQGDGWSCGILSCNALAHHFLPNSYPLVETGDEDLGRLRMLQRILDLNELTAVDAPHVSQGLIAHLDSQNNASPLITPRSVSVQSKLPHTRPHTPPPTTSRSSNASQLHLSPMKPGRKRSNSSELQPSAREKSQKKLTSSRTQGVGLERFNFKPVAARAIKIPKEVVQNISESNESDDSDNDSDDNSQPRVKVVQNRKGRPTNSLLDRTTVRVAGTKHYNCSHLQGTDLVREVSATLIALSLGSQLAATSIDDQPTSSPTPISTSLVTASSGLTPSPHLPLAHFKAFEAKGKQDYKLKVDHAILKLISALGLPPYALDLAEWKEAWYEASRGAYTPVSRNKFTDFQVPAEVAHVKNVQIEYLKHKINLTISFDGGSIRQLKGFYSIHVTTPERESYFIEGVDGRGVSHTGKWISEQLLRVMDYIGRSRFAGVASDNTANTTDARNRVYELVPTVIVCPDPPHHLNNMVKDLVNLECFKEICKVVRTALSHFSHSQSAREMLDALRKLAGIGRGLQSITKTRFATFVHAALSLMRCLTPIQQLVTSGQIKFKKYNEMFIQDSAAAMRFKLGLMQLIAVCAPVARAIRCLEGAQVNLADVYLLWLAVTASISDVLTDSNVGISASVSAEIRGIVKFRHDQYFEHGPNDAHLSAFYLNPEYSSSGVFSRPNALKPTIIIPPLLNNKPAPSRRDIPADIPNPRTFRRVSEYLFKVAVAEIQHGDNPIFLQYRDRPKTFAEVFKQQMLAYARGVYPFNTPLSPEQTILAWWSQFLSSASTQIVAALAVKLYSILPHSMADERTASTINWLNAPRRANQKVATVVGLAQLNQHYRVSRRKARPNAHPSPKLEFVKIIDDIMAETASAEDVEDGGSVASDEDDFEEVAPAKAGAGVDDWFSAGSQPVEPSDELRVGGDDEIDLAADELREVLMSSAERESTRKGKQMAGASVTSKESAEEEEAEEEAGSFELQWS